MTPHAARTIALILLPIAVTLGYAFACWVWPFKPCGRCDGTGKRRSPTGRAFRLCPRCDGTGRRLRAGRWIYNQFNNTRQAGR
ncbi:hypothetical protein GCM10010399_32240 [Dactylosporangium fulvum]|uniref:Uncharacterized protein n=1 Tax=Dactylosporangium fulvum TaxID=53359 RepID=A0ABY5W1X6_9ACTN|nr:hypothetical protein [Dactylosporangium fulvum]UWP83920.1 hypothetical protein Dfulv_06605 [Dactylosporangium fulvum]